MFYIIKLYAYFCLIHDYVYCSKYAMQVNSKNSAGIDKAQKKAAVVKPSPLN